MWVLRTERVVSRAKVGRSIIDFAPGGCGEGAEEGEEGLALLLVGVVNDADCLADDGLEVFEVVERCIVGGWEETLEEAENGLGARCL
jgi:hypothetical protein